MLRTQIILFYYWKSVSPFIIIIIIIDKSNLFTSYESATS
jgi:hypothetical protein